MTRIALFQKCSNLGYRKPSGLITNSLKFRSAVVIPKVEFLIRSAIRPVSQMCVFIAVTRMHPYAGFQSVDFDSHIVRLSMRVSPWGVLCLEPHGTDASCPRAREYAAQKFYSNASHVSLNSRSIESPSKTKTRHPHTVQEIPETGSSRHLKGRVTSKLTISKTL